MLWNLQRKMKLIVLSKAHYIIKSLSSQRTHNPGSHIELRHFGIFPPCLYNEILRLCFRLSFSEWSCDQEMSKCLYLRKMLFFRWVAPQSQKWSWQLPELDSSSRWNLRNKKTLSVSRLWGCPGRSLRVWDLILLKLWHVWWDWEWWRRERSGRIASFCTSCTVWMWWVTLALTAVPQPLNSSWRFALLVLLVTKKNFLRFLCHGALRLKLFC